METLSERLSEHGIRLRSHDAGEHRTTCPKCSHTRAKKTDPCLAVRIDHEGATWVCHHCGDTGAVSDRSPANGHVAARPAKKAPPAKPKQTIGEPTPAVLAWFAARGLPEAVVHRNRIGAARVFLPGRGAEVDCIAFSYLRNGEVVNAKFRSLDGKDFAQVKGAEKILFGLDDIADANTAIIVEGECDKLALEVAGYRNVVSVPDGAPAKVKAGEPDPGDAKFSFLATCAAYLDRLGKIILAVDADGPGRALEEELARRLGRERCWRVRWPDSNDTARKDANEVLLFDGAEVLKECIEAAEAYPIAGLHRAQDFADETVALYRDGRARGYSTGWPAVDDLMTIREGDLSVVTGIPNSGKSEFIDALAVNLADKFGWRFALCSFENPPPDHLAKLAEKRAGLPFWDGPTQRMTEAELRTALAWVNDRFYLIRADDESPTIDFILEAARGAVLRHGVRGLVIDPYNEIEHKRPANMSETEFVSQVLGKVKRFAQNHGVHVWFVAHPAKPPREDGKIRAPVLYDISGSANWANKADFGVVVHRPDPLQPMTEIHIRKVRWKQTGRIGVATLRYDRATGRYSEVKPAAGSDRWGQD